MKTIGILFVGLALASPVLAQDRAQQIQSAYQQGLIAVREGEVELARDAFTGVLELDPNHANARFQLNQLGSGADQLRLRKRELALSRIVVPEVNFDGATVKEALSALSTIIERVSEKKFAANFVIRDPSGVLAKREISLNLRGVPATAVLKYVCEQSGAIYRIEEHAIVLRLPSGAVAAAPSGPSTEPVAEPAGKQP